MSTTIEQKVVEMRFDNKHFEKHTKESMSTLEKLKQKLNLSGASKGLENLNTSANKVNMNGLCNALDTAHSKFSALEIMGVTALANITNSAVNAGKRIVKALTIDPITDGWSEYEMTLNAVQTTMAATGKTSSEVEKELKKLDEYADKTVYSTADMLSNLPKFTNAGVELETATQAMIGIANATAHAGGDAGKASIAFYNLGQAIGTGYLTRMDYNSINNAGIATMRWKEEMVKAAIAAGTLTQVGDDLYQAGNKTMTLQQLFIDGLQEQWASTEVMLEVFGKYGDETTEIGKAAYSSAQDIKTFSMMMDSLKATAGTGWKDTWQIIFGNLEEAKEFWTGLTNFISGIIEGMADIRNFILESALGRSFGHLLDGIKKPFKTIENTIENIKDYTQVVDEIINGKWGNGQQRWDALTQAGYDWKHAQNLVNEELGVSLRRAADYKEVQGQIAKTQVDSNVAWAKSILMLTQLSDAELKAKNLSDEQIASLRELEKVSRQTGIPLKQLVENIDEIDGRWILINSFKNIGQGIVATLGAIRDAWFEIFPPTGDVLFNIIAAFHKFSTYLRVSEEAADKLKRTFKGVFAVLDMVLTIISAPIKIAFKILLQLLGALDIGVDGILSFTARLGDALVFVRDLFDELFDFSLIFEILAPYIKAGARALMDWLGALKNSSIITKFVDSLRNAKKAIKDWFVGMKDAKNIPKYIFEGLVNGLKYGANKVFDTMMNFGKKLLEVICKVLGIESPSTKFFEIGKYIIQGLVNGIQNGVGYVFSLLKGFGETCVKIFNSIDFGKVLAAGIGIGTLLVVIKTLSVINSFLSPLEGLGDMFEGIGVGVAGLGKGIHKWGQAKLIESFAKSIAVLAGAVVVLALIKKDDLWRAVGAIAALAVVMGALTFVVNKSFGGKNNPAKSAEEAKDMGRTVTAFLGMAAALYLMASVFKKLAGLGDSIDTAIKGLIAMVVGLSVLFVVFGKFVKGDAAQNLDKAAVMISKIGFSLLLMSFAVKLVSGMKPGDIGKGILIVYALTAMMAGLIAISKLAGDSADKAGKMISKMAFALLITLLVIKIAAKLDGEEFAKGFAVILSLGYFFSVLIAVSYFAGEHAAKAGAMMLMMSIAMAITVSVIKQASSIGLFDLAKAVPVLTALGGLFAGLIYISKYAGTNAIKAGAMLLMASGAILILVGILFVLSKMDIPSLYKVLPIVYVLETLLGGLIYVSKYAGEAAFKSLATITVMITLLVAALIGLTFINPKKLATSTAAISSVLVSLAAVLASTKFLGSAKTLITNLAPIVIVMGILAGLIILMNDLDPEAAIGSAAALSLLMLSMSVMLATTSLLGKFATKGLLALAGVTAVVAALAGVLYFLDEMDVEASMKNVAAISALLLAMSYTLVILTAVGLGGPAAFIGLGALGTLIVGLGIIVGAFGWLATEIEGLEGFLDKGIPILEKIGYALGSFFGNIVSGFMTGTTSNLPAIGAKLTGFMEEAKGFITGAKDMDEDAVNGVANLAKAILILSAANFVESIVEMLPFADSFAELGTELSDFMRNAQDFIKYSADVKPEIMVGVKTLAEALSLLTKAELLDAIASKLTGEKSLAAFGQQLGGENGLGASLAAFVTSLGTFGPDQLTIVKNACDAIKVLAEAANAIPGTDGLWQKLVGEHSLAKFGEDFKNLGNDLNAFVASLTNFGGDQKKAVKNACDAIIYLAEAADAVPAQDGLWQRIFGENSLAKFGTDLSALGVGLSSFMRNIGEFDGDNVSTVKCACQAIVALADAANNVPEDTAWDRFWGNDDVGTFSENLKKMGTGIKSFAKELGTFGEDKIATVKCAVDAIKIISGLGKIDLEATSTGMQNFGITIIGFGNRVKEFVRVFSEINTDGLSASIARVRELIDMAKSISATGTSSINSFSDALAKFSKTVTNDFVKAFSGEEAIKKASNGVNAIMDSIINSAEKKKQPIADKFTEVANKAVSALSAPSLVENTKQAGRNLGDGLILGMNSRQTLVYLAGFALGQKAVQGEKDGQKSKSPSKLTYQAGIWLGEGLVNGMIEMGKKVYNAGHDLGDQATRSMSSTISKVADAINSDMDTQPTIRPVLDLSDVESGAGYLNSMFNEGPSIGVMSNLRAISSGVNSRLQNGVNGEVVSAIDKLRKDLGNVGGTTNNYNVNGVTYDDGSNITEAVRTIVRAATMGRRV